MSILSPNQFAKAVREYVRLQTALQREFLKQNSAVHDWKFLTDVPRHGHVRALGVKWSYTKHGLGVRFFNDQKGVVDVHNHVSVSGLVDAQRMCEYIVSLDARLGQNVNLHSECRRALELVSSTGLIRKSALGDEIWRAD